MAGGVVGGVDHPFDRLGAGPEGGERLGEDPTGGIIGEADSADERIGPALQTAQGVAVATAWSPATPAPITSTLPG